MDPLYIGRTINIINNVYSYRLIEEMSNKHFLYQIKKYINKKFRKKH